MDEEDFVSRFGIPPEYETAGSSLRLHMLVDGFRRLDSASTPVSHECSDEVRSMETAPHSLHMRRTIPPPIRLSTPLR